MDLYRTAQRLPRQLQGTGEALTYAELVASGISRSAALWRAEHGGLTRVCRDAYVVGPPVADLLDRIRAVLRVCPDAVVGFATAAVLQGFGIVEDDDIHLVYAAGGTVPQRAGVRVHQSVVPVRPVLWHGIPCTPPARTAVDLARVLDRVTALAVLDAALSAGVTVPRSLTAELAHHRKLRRVPQRWWPLPTGDRSAARRLTCGSSCTTRGCGSSSRKCPSTTPTACCATGWIWPIAAGASPWSTTGRRTWTGNAYATTGSVTTGSTAWAGGCATSPTGTSTGAPTGSSRSLQRPSAADRIIDPMTLDLYT